MAKFHVLLIPGRKSCAEKTGTFLPVAYYDQQMHACACVCMVENDKKCYKILPLNWMANLSFQKID